MQVKKLHNSGLYSKTITPYLFLAPTLVLFAVFHYIPSFASLVMSFNEYHVFDEMKWVGLDNYVKMFKDPLFLITLWNTAKYFIIIVPSLVILPLFIAMLVNTNLRGVYFFRLLYYMPNVISMVSISIAWLYLFHPDGLINALIKVLGLYGSNAPVNWLFNPKTALPSVAFTEIWKVCGYFMVIYLAGLQSVSNELVEAVKIDGGTKKHVFFHVIIPTLRPTMAVTMTLAAINAAQIFTSVYVMTGGGPLNSTYSLALYIYEEAFKYLNMGYASAMGIVLWIILMVVSILNYKFNSGKEIL